MYSPSWLSNELQKVIANENPLNGIKLGIALSKFSLSLIPPTLGVATGILPAVRAYEFARQFDKITGIENAVNAFAKQNAIGMSTLTGGLFTGQAPPPLKGTKILYEVVRIKQQDAKFLCDALARAIYVNWTLGRSTFNPLGILIPTWNIPLLPKRVRDKLKEDGNNLDDFINQAKAASAKAIAETSRIVTSYDVEEYQKRSTRFD
jgi:hypothetical protein